MCGCWYRPSAIGNISALNTATVRTQVSGVLHAVRFQEGQQIKAGHLRLRPVLMITVAAMLGAVPLAISHRPSAMEPSCASH